MNKTLIKFILIWSSLLLVSGCFYIKYKHDEARFKEEEKRYIKIQKNRITLYMKVNYKGYRSIHYTSYERNPAGGYFIYGYINNDPSTSFCAFHSSDNNQFEGGLIANEKLIDRIDDNGLSVTEIINKQHLNPKDYVYDGKYLFY